MCRGLSSSFDRDAANAGLRGAGRHDQRTDLVRIYVARHPYRPGHLGKRALRTRRHDDIDRPKDLPGARRRRMRIAHDVTCLSASVGNLAHRLPERPLDRTADHDPRPLGRERERDRAADRAATVIHDDNLAVERLHPSLHEQTSPFIPRAWYTVRVTRKQVVSRAVYGVFVVIVGAFIISNIWQVARVTFGEQSGASIPKVEAACGAAIEKEIAAIDRARETASAEHDGEAARATYAAARKKESSDAKTACANDPHGVDALAAVGRLDRSAESHAVRDASEIGPMRQTARSFIRVPQ